jgi:hypothetical protein
MRPLDPTGWRLEPPAAGSRAPLIVSFARPLDHGLLLSALTVQSGGKPVEGEASVADGETEWWFTPREPWRAGDYALVAQAILEDPAGNQIGRAFEIDTAAGRKGAEPQTTTLPFKVGA